MSAVEEIRAAIEKLQDLKYQVDPGPLVRWRDQEPPMLMGQWDGFYVIGDSAEEGEDCNPVARVYTEEGVDLIVTLHRTIDAQLAILRAAVSAEVESADHWAEVGKPHLRGPAKIVPLNMAALALARAINEPTK